MDKKRLIAAIEEFAASKNIDRPTIIHMLREVLLQLITKKFGSSDNFDVIIDARKGDLQIFRTLTIVPDELANTSIQKNQISLSEARKIEKDFQPGEELVEELGPHLFSRRAVVQGIKLFVEKKNTLDQAQLYSHYQSLIGKLITAQVFYNTPKYTILHDEDKNELILPKSEQIRGERFRTGSAIKALITEVQNKTFKVQILVSRASPAFLQEVLSLEIPEIVDNIVIIKGLARIPGRGSKVIVDSEDKRVDASAACIGPGGRRIRNISKEHLNNEHVHIISYTDNLNRLIQRIVGLDNPVDVMQNNDNSITIYGNPKQIPILYDNLPFLKQLLDTPINIRHATQSTEAGVEEDVYLDEFQDEISREVLNTLKEHGFHTAKNVLKINKEALAKQTNLEKTIIETLYATLAKEFVRP